MKCIVDIKWTMSPTPHSFMLLLTVGNSIIGFVWHDKEKGKWKASDCSSVRERKLLAEEFITHESAKLALEDYFEIERVEKHVGETVEKLEKLLEYKVKGLVDKEDGDL